MKKRFVTLACVLLCGLSSLAQNTPTPNIGLQIPATGSNNWYIPLNYNFNLLDQLLSGNALVPALHVSGNLTVGGTLTAASFSPGSGVSFVTTPGSSSNYAPYFNSASGIAGVGISGLPWYSTSAIPRAATVTDFSAWLAANGTGCATSGNAYNPATNNCAPASGSSPLTTKGDLLGFSTVNARVPIGTDGQILTADSTQTLGLKWAPPSPNISPQTIQANGTSCDIVYKNPAGTITKVELFACSAITDYSNASTVGSLEWAIQQLGNNGGEIQMHPGLYPIAATVLIDYDWITIEGTQLPYWNSDGHQWPATDAVGTPGGAQLVNSASGYPTFTIGSTSANMHGDTRHKGIELRRLYGYGANLAGTSFIRNAVAGQTDDNIRIEDNIMQGYTACVIQETWDYHDIVRNTIQNNGGDGICETGGFFGYISGNIFFDLGGEALTLSGGHLSLVSNNRFGLSASAGTLSGGTGIFVDNVVDNMTSSQLTVSTTGWIAYGGTGYAAANYSNPSGTFNSAVSISAGTANNALTVTGSNTVATQFLMSNSSSGSSHSYAFFTNGSFQFTGWGGVYDANGGGDAYSFMGGATAFFNLHSGGVFGWTASATRALGSPDTGLSRDSAGVVDVGTGAKGSTAGSIKATNSTLSGTLTAANVTATTSISAPSITATSTTTAMTFGVTGGYTGPLNMPAFCPNGTGFNLFSFATHAGSPNRVTMSSCGELYITTPAGQGGYIGDASHAAVAAWDGAGHFDVGSLNSGNNSNNDVNGELTLVSGTASYTFTSYESATGSVHPVCVANDETNEAAVRVTYTGGSGVAWAATFHVGTSTDVINYICTGRGN